MLSHIPKDVTKIEKQGFSAPDASWFRGESIEFVKRKISNDHAKIYEFMDRQLVEPLVKQHLNAEQNRWLLIWSLLYVSNWLELINESPPGI